MVGSEVDHKYLGRFAKSTVALNSVLSAGLYKLLGLSTLLSRKLLRARKQRKLDPTRPTKSLDLYRHILWMAREGLSILRNDVLPELANHLPPSSSAGTATGAVGARSAYAFLNELHVLALKMHASFLHILVLFDHTYQTKPPPPPSSASASAQAAPSTTAQAQTPTTAAIQTKAAKVTPALAAFAHMAPTIDAFNRADVMANRLLPSSHPLRLSVKVEFAAFTYDCTRDYETSRRIAKTAVEEALSSLDPVDDESFEDAMESNSPPPPPSTSVQRWMGKLRLVLEWSAP